MIVTLTPNPSLDRTIEIPELHRGEVHRATGGRVDPGGKGVNVSRALAANDVATVTVLPSGGPEGAQLAALLAPFGVQTVQVPISGTVRSNITVAEPDGTTTKLNEAGPELTPDEAAAVERTVVELAGRASWAPSGPPEGSTAMVMLLRTVPPMGTWTVCTPNGASSAASCAPSGPPEGRTVTVATSFAASARDTLTPLPPGSTRPPVARCTSPRRSSSISTVRSRLGFGVSVTIIDNPYRPSSASWGSSARTAALAACASPASRAT